MKLNTEYYCFVIQKSTKFKVKNNNESMYLGDSISFEPSKTPRTFPNKKTSFTIIFCPKSVHVPTTLEYFTIFSTDDDHIEMNDDEFNEYVYKSPDEIVQKITVCVQGSCYGKFNRCRTYMTDVPV